MQWSLMHGNGSWARPACYAERTHDEAVYNIWSVYNHRYAASAVGAPSFSSMERISSGIDASRFASSRLGRTGRFNFAT